MLRDALVQLCRIVGDASSDGVHSTYQSVILARAQPITITAGVEVPPAPIVSQSVIPQLLFVQPAMSVDE